MGLTDRDVSMRDHVLTPSEREDFFARKGYLVVPDALPPEVVERAATSRITKTASASSASRCESEYARIARW